MRKAGIFIVLFLGSSLAAAGQAVSEINGKFDYLGGDMDSFEGHNLSGSFTVPLATNFGLQADGLYTHVSGRDFLGAGAHLFWRDWDKGLLGLTAATVHQDGIDAYEGGLEAEYYLEKFTLGARAGAAGIEYDRQPVPFIETDVTDFYMGAELRYYPLDDLMASAAWDHAFDNNLLTARFEYLTPVRGLSVLAEFARGSNDYDHVLFGLRFYLGGNKKLKLRHRQDDPASVVGRTFYAIGTYGAEYNRNERDYVEARGGQYTGGGYGLVMDCVTPSDPFTPEDFRQSLQQELE